MRLERILSALVILVCAGFAAAQWRQATHYRGQNSALQARLESLEQEAAASAEAAGRARGNADKLRTQTSEVLRLRDEVTQLRASAKNNEALAAENQRLRAENQQLSSRASSASASAPPAAPAGEGPGQFPRASWTFAGYGSPEAALVSAIWAMREGDPRVYLESLAPQEQQRMARTWQEKSEAEVAEKHKNDVAAISGLRVLERQTTAPHEVMMNVYLEGPGRVERIRMTQVGEEWKFGGFVREAPPSAPPQP